MVSRCHQPGDMERLATPAVDVDGHSMSASSPMCPLTEFVDSCVALFFAFDGARLFPTCYYPTEVMLRFEEARNRAAEAGLYTENDPTCTVCGKPGTQRLYAYHYCPEHFERVSLMVDIMVHKPALASLTLASQSTETLHALAGPTQDHMSQQDEHIQQFLDGLLTLDELAGLLEMSVHDTRHLVSPRVFAHALLEADKLTQLPRTLKNSC